MNEFIVQLKHFIKNKIFLEYFKFAGKWLIIPICVLNTFLFCYFSFDAVSNYRNSIRSEALLSSSNIDNTINNINNFANGLMTHRDVNLFLLETSYNVKKSQSYYELRNYLSSTILLNDTIANVSLFNPNYNYVLSVNSSDYIANIPSKNWYEAIPANLFNFVCDSPNDSNLISFCYNIKNHNKYLGTLIIDVNKEKFCKSLSSSDTGLYLYMYDNDKILSLSEKHQSPPSDWLKKICIENIYDQHINDNIIYTPTPLNNTTGILISCSGNNFLSGINVVHITYYILILLILVIVIVGLSLYSSFRLYTQILQFTQEFENLIIGYTSDYQIPVFKDLSTKILTLKDSHKQLEQKLLNQIDTIKKLQSMALQIQFNPHFLFNTLNSINTHILNITKQDCEATIIISNLAEILHHSLNTEVFFTTVEEEIYYCKKYIEIELIKHKNSFDIEWDVPPSFYNQQIIKMCIQPILENALKHGILALKDKRGKITIQAYNTEHNLVIKITNNGVPLKRNELYKLRELMNSEVIPETEHIGLLNINQRIRIAYGNNYTIKISSNNEKTSFYLKFPFV